MKRKGQKNEQKSLKTPWMKWGWIVAGFLSGAVSASHSFAENAEVPAAPSVLPHFVMEDLRDCRAGKWGELVQPPVGPLHPGQACSTDGGLPGAKLELLCDTASNLVRADSRDATVHAAFDEEILEVKNQMAYFELLAKLPTEFVTANLDPAKLNPLQARAYSEVIYAQAALSKLRPYIQGYAQSLAAEKDPSLPKSVMNHTRDQLDKKIRDAMSQAGFEPEANDAIAQMAFFTATEAANKKSPIPKDGEIFTPEFVANLFHVSATRALESDTLGGRLGRIVAAKDYYFRKDPSVLSVFNKKPERSIGEKIWDEATELVIPGSSDSSKKIQSDSKTLSVTKSVLDDYIAREDERIRQLAKPGDADRPADAKYEGERQALCDAAKKFSLQVDELNLESMHAVGKDFVRGTGIMVVPAMVGGMVAKMGPYLFLIHGMEKMSDAAEAFVVCDRRASTGDLENRILSKNLEIAGKKVTDDQIIAWNKSRAEQVRSCTVGGLIQAGMAAVDVALSGAPIAHELSGTAKLAQKEAAKVLKRLLGEGATKEVAEAAAAAAADAIDPLAKLIQQGVWGSMGTGSSMTLYSSWQGWRDAINDSSVVKGSSDRVALLGAMRTVSGPLQMAALHGVDVLGKLGGTEPQIEPRVKVRTKEPNPAEEPHPLNVTYEIQGTQARIQEDHWTLAHEPEYFRTEYLDVVKVSRRPANDPLIVELLDVLEKEYSGDKVKVRKRAKEIFKKNNRINCAQ